MTAPMPGTGAVRRGRINAIKIATKGYLFCSCCRRPYPPSDKFYATFAEKAGVAVSDVKQWLDRSTKVRPDIAERIRGRLTSVDE
jgi:hypothetical protein